MRRIAIIPVKRRSMRLPEKNIRLFAGKPMFLHSVEAALTSDLFDRVVVSTSDEQVKEWTRQTHAYVHDRLEKLDRDEARLVDVCEAVLGDESAVGRNYDIMVVLLSTAPMRNADDIIKVVEIAEQRPSGGALAVTGYSHSPHQALKLDESGAVTPMWPNLIAKREEEMPRLRVDNGSTYALYVPSFLKEKTFYVDNLCAYEMPPHRSVDLDDENDLELLEYYYARHSCSLDA